MSGTVAGLRVRYDVARAAEGGQELLDFLRMEALHPADFTIREDGVVVPELVRRAAQVAGN
jgi:hypothetical protein